MQEILDNLKLMHEAAREEYEKSKKCPLGLDEHKALQASFELLDKTLCGAEKAVEKQIQKKLVRGFDEEMLCAGCSAFICFLHNTKSEMHRQAKYCEFCGQAIDWGE